MDPKARLKDMDSEGPLRGIKSIFRSPSIRALRWAKASLKPWWLMILKAVMKSRFRSFKEVSLISVLLTEGIPD